MTVRVAQSSVRADQCPKPPRDGRAEEIRAVIEIVAAADGDPPIDLLCEVYAASRCGVIGLVLNGLAAVAVDRVFDRIVPMFPLTIPGVVYLDLRNRTLLRAAFRRSSMIIGQSEEFRSLASGSGVLCKGFPHSAGELGTLLDDAVKIPERFAMAREASHVVHLTRPAANNWSKAQ